MLSVYAAFDLESSPVFVVVMFIHRAWLFPFSYGVSSVIITTYVSLLSSCVCVLASSFAHLLLPVGLACGRAQTFRGS